MQRGACSFCQETAELPYKILGDPVCDQCAETLRLRWQMQFPQPVNRRIGAIVAVLVVMGLAVVWWALNLWAWR